MAANDHEELSSGQSSPRTPSSAGSVHKASSRSVGPRRLLEIVEQVYKSFNPGQVTLDTHVDNCLGQRQLSNSHDETFVRQVVYGIVRYRSFLGCIMDSFYHYNGGIALREDMDMYKIFGYLTVFRLEELGHANLKRLVDAKEPQKMVVFFRYLLNPHYLHSALRDDWLKLYDKQFVDDIIAQLEAATPEMAHVLDALDDKVYFTRRRAEGRAMSTTGSIADCASASAQGASIRGQAVQAAGTVPQPFNLSQPRAKPLPVQVPAPSPPKARPAPKPREGPTKEELALKAARQANRKEVEARHAAAAAFDLRCTERPSSLEKIRAEITADMERHLTFKPPKPTPVPPAPTAQVRLNAAAVLREDALYRKKQAEEAAALQRYEAELRDARTFKSWQQEMLAMDEATRAARVEARRVEMAAVADAAIKARAAQVAANQEISAALKAEAQKVAATLETEREEDLRVKQAKRAQVAEARAGVAVAAEKLAADKRSAAEEERKKQAADAKALMEAQLRENAEKRDIIMQLRALEKVPRQRVKEFDPTHMPDHGLLDSMSLVELRERLAVARRHEQEEEERRRASNLAARQEREAMILKKAANVARIRKVAAAQAAGRKTANKQEAASKQLVMVTKHEGSVLILTDKLESKRSASAAEKTRIAAETKKIRFEQMQQAAGAAVVEANKFQELRSGAGRAAKARQATRLQDASVYEATKSKAQNVRMQVVKSAQHAKADFLREYEERLAAATGDMKLRTQAEFEDRKHKANACHNHENDTRNLKRSSSYVPSTCSTKTTMQARLTALAHGLHDSEF